MIPKIIHYCWFGGKEKPKDVVKYIRSWKKFCPDYEIFEWNESNFDLEQNVYVKEAYMAKKWAFVTDYVRLFALKKYGGIYMDTDVEVIKPLDRFLVHNAFSGFESTHEIPTGIMASEKDGEWVSLLISDYDNRHFVFEDGSFDLTTNVITITKTTEENYPVALDNTYQEIKGILALYPNDYFCPKDYFTGKINRTENTHCIHHFSGSWQPKEAKKDHRRQILYRKIFGEKIGVKLIQLRGIIVNPDSSLTYAIKHFLSKHFRRK